MKKHLILLSCLFPLILSSCSQIPNNQISNNINIESKNTFKKDELIFNNKVYKSGDSIENNIQLNR